MKKKINSLNKTSEIWNKIIEEALEIKKKEPLITFFVDKKIGIHNSFN